MSGRESFKKYNLLINVFSRFLKIFGYKINYKLFTAIRHVNGKIGIGLRYVIAKNIFQNLGDNVSFHSGVYVFNAKHISIGQNVSIHPMCYLEGAGGISIGNDVSIAHNTSLISTNHTWSDIDKPIKYNKETFSKINIEDDVWIGCGVRILSGVHIKNRSVIAAGAVVNKSVDNYSVYAGVPAKKIKSI